MLLSLGLNFKARIVFGPLLHGLHMNSINLALYLRKDKVPLLQKRPSQITLDKQIKKQKNPATANKLPLVVQVVSLIRHSVRVILLLRDAHTDADELTC